MRTLQNSELTSVVGGVVAGDDPNQRDSMPQRMFGESLADYNLRVQEYLTQKGSM